MKTVIIFLLVISTLFFMSFTYNSGILPDQDKWVAPASSKELVNPFSGVASISKGESIYKTRCVVCHGITGKGDGPAGASLTPKAADHASESVQSQTDGEIFWKMSEGRGPMVGWKLIISEEDRWNLVNYIRTLAE